MPMLANNRQLGLSCPAPRARAGCNPASGPDYLFYRRFQAIAVKVHIGKQLGAGGEREHELTVIAGHAVEQTASVK